MRCTPSTPQVVALVCSGLVMSSAVIPCHAAATKNGTVLSTGQERTYAQVRVLQVDPNGVTIRHKDGIAKVLFDDLSEADRRRFKYNKIKADEFVRKHRGQASEAEPVDVRKKEAGNETTVNLNITVSQAPRRQLVWTVPYPYYRYPQTRGLVRPVWLRTNVIRPWYPYNTFSYQWRHGFAGCGVGHPFLMFGGYGYGRVPLSVYGHSSLPACLPYSMLEWRRRSWCDLFRHTNLLHQRPFPFGPFTYPHCL